LKKAVIYDKIKIMRAKNERTVVIIKPDGVQRSLVGEIIRRYERTGLKLAGLKFLIPTKELVKRHYSADPNWIVKTGQKAIDTYTKQGLKPPIGEPRKCGESVLKRLQDYLSSGPVIVMVWQGNEAVGIVRKITGGTEPLTSDVGTIRGDLTVDSYRISDVSARAIRNLIHASGAPDEAEKEIKVWFKPHEILKYRLINEAILYDVNLDGIKE